MARCIFSEIFRKSCTAFSARFLGMASRSSAGGRMSPFLSSSSGPSRDDVSGAITYFSWYFDLFLRYSAPQQLSLASGSPHRTQVDRVSKECEGFIKIYSLRKRHSFGDNQSEFATQYGLNTKAPNTAQNFLRTKHKHNVLISGREKLYSDKFCFIDPLCEIFDGGSVWNVSHHRR